MKRSNINKLDRFQLDYEQSLFPLRDSRGKRTRERVQKSPKALKRDARVEPASVVLLSTSAARHPRHVSTRQAILRSLAYSFIWTVPERKELLLVVYIVT